MSALHPTTRDLARILGEPRYYPAKTCPAGHTEGRYTSNRHCVACHNAKSPGWPKTDTRTNAEKHRARNGPPTKNTGSARYAARLTGATRYPSEKPCPKGHTDERFTRTGACVTCWHEIVATKKRAPKDKAREKMRRLKRRAKHLAAHLSTDERNAFIEALSNIPPH